MGRFVKASTCCISKRKKNSQLSGGTTNTSSGNTGTSTSVGNSVNKENGDDKNNKSTAKPTGTQWVNTFILLMNSGVNVTLTNENVKRNVKYKCITVDFSLEFNIKLTLEIHNDGYAVPEIKEPKLPEDCRDNVKLSQFKNLHKIWEDANTYGKTYNLAECDSIIDKYKVLKKVWDKWSNEKIWRDSTTKSFTKNATSVKQQYQNVYNYMCMNSKIVEFVKNNDYLAPIKNGHDGGGNKYKYFVRFNFSSDYPAETVLCAFIVSDANFSNPQLYWNWMKQ